MSSRILVMICGSVAAYKACHVISRLKQAGHEIEVVSTTSALKFIGEATLEGLTGKPVHKDLFSAGAAMSHIDLIRWADLAIVVPATANTINKLAHGVGDDLITTLFLAHAFDKPWLIAPAMNTKMYHHPVTQASILKLQQMGCEILETASGVLACGEVGDGKLLDPDLILASIQDRLSKTPGAAENADRGEFVQNKKILITSGGTEEPIDPVRSITNKSTGQTGALLAESLLKRGHTVYFLSAEHSVQPEVASPFSERFQSTHFITFRDLADRLEETLRAESFDAVVHAAAVSDYSLADGPAATKTDSADEIVLKLKRNPKLIDRIRSWSKNSAIQIVAFKLTATTENEDRTAKLKRLVENSKPDFVVANDVNDLPAWTLHQHDFGEVSTIARGNQREQLAHSLGNILEGAL